MAGQRQDFFDVPTYTTTLFGSTLAVMGVTPDLRRDLECVRLVSAADRQYRKLFFANSRLVGAIIIRPPKGRKKLIELIRSTTSTTPGRSGSSCATCWPDGCLGLLRTCTARQARPRSSWRASSTMSWPFPCSLY